MLQKQVSYANYIILFRILWGKTTIKKHLLEIELFCNNVKVFSYFAEWKYKLFESA